MGSPVASPVLETVQQPTIRQKRQALACYWRAASITAQTLQSHAVMSRDADIGMDAETGNRSTTRPRRYGDVFQIDCVARLGDSAAGTRAGGYAPGNGSSIEFSEQRLALLEGNGRVTIGQAAAFEKPGNTALNAFGHTGHFIIAGRRRRAAKETLQPQRYLDPWETGIAKRLSRTSNSRRRSLHPQKVPWFLKNLL